MAKSFQKMHEEVVNFKLPIDDLGNEAPAFVMYANRLEKAKSVDEKELKAFLMLCLDFYVFSTTGKVLIPDIVYDRCMNIWKELSGGVLVYPDDLLRGQTTWEFKNHTYPGLVGTVSKVYEYSEIKAYMTETMRGVHTFILAPKYDGVSAAIEVDDNGQIISALTRYDGIRGQDITKAVKRAKNATTFFAENGKLKPGLYKCELLVGQTEFVELVKDKDYANRRSATTGIISTPKNLEYARYLTIVPLIWYESGVGEKGVHYIPPHSETVSVYSPRDLMDAVEKKLDKVKNVDFDFRVDGVVIYPVYPGLPFDEMDLMHHAVAFKVNTAEAKTTIEYGYMSVGRLGNGIPMVKVKPVEVNETIVTDVSLGSYARFLGLNLYEGEEVIIYSAGDVIPQLKLPEMRHNLWNAEPLKIKKRCPYCGEKLERDGSEYYCGNQNCSRVISGRISNFIIKVGVKGFSDETIESLYAAGLVKSIPDLFSVTRESISALPGFGEISATSFVEEIERIRETPIPISKLIGALGIDNISEKKCRRIFEVISLKELLNKKPGKIKSIIQSADGIAEKTATIFVEFVDKNRDLIEYLANTMKLTDDVTYKGNVVFSGFTNLELAERFKEIGYEVPNAVTTKTVAVVTTDTTYSTGNCKKAIANQIPIYAYDEADVLLEQLKRGPEVS